MAAKPTPVDERNERLSGLSAGPNGPSNRSSPVWPLRRPPRGGRRRSWRCSAYPRGRSAWPPAPASCALIGANGSRRSVRSPRTSRTQRSRSRTAGDPSRSGTATSFRSWALGHGPLLDASRRHAGAADGACPAETPLSARWRMCGRLRAAPLGRLQERRRRWGRRVDPPATPTGGQGLHPPRAAGPERRRRPPGPPQPLGCTRPPRAAGPERRPVAAGRGLPPVSGASAARASRRRTGPSASRR